MTVDRNDPGAGDPWRLRSSAWDHWQRAAEITRTTESVAAAARTAAMSWEGRAHDAFQGAVAALRPDLAVLAESVASTGEALMVYAESIARIKDRQETLERLRARLNDERGALEHAWTIAYNESQGPFITYIEPAARAASIAEEVRALRPEIEALDDDWEALVRAREHADEDFVGALGTRDVRGSLFAFTDANSAGVPGGELLALLGTMSPADMKALAASRPHVWERMLGATPEAVAAWWSGLGDGDIARRDAARVALVENLSVVVGAMGGVPAEFRVAANRILAGERLARARSEREELEEHGYGASSFDPYAREAAAAAHLERLAALDSEVGYLERVARGDVRLYLYEPGRERIIEMFGDPANADALLTFMPGTNTSMESFYTSTTTAGVTALTRWQVEHPYERTPVAGFVVKQGDFPHLAALASEGPQHNWYADVLGSRYAALAHELGVITEGTPIVSVEHSFGSAVGGSAETRGAVFDARYMLAGIGMTDDWRPVAGTSYYAALGPGDINRYLDDMQLGGLGYETAPSEVPGVVETDTGFMGGEWAPFLLPVVPVAGVPLLVDTALDQHNRIISGDDATNGDVLENVRSALDRVAHR